MAVFIKSIGGSTEGTLESKGIDEVELLPHHHSGCGLTGLLHDKVAVVETEVLSVLMEEHWKYSFLESISFGVGASIHEAVLLSRVSMVVTIEQYVSAFQSFLHHHFDSKVLRTHL